MTYILKFDIHFKIIIINVISYLQVFAPLPGIVMSNKNITSYL